MKTLPLVLSFVGGLAMASLASAQDHSGHSGGHEMQPAQAVPGRTASTALSTEAFEAANAVMHQAMAILYTGNADVDFARAMIAHHEGAVAMARVQLDYGKDPEMRKLAEEIIAAQGPEIAEMKAWLEKSGQ